MSPIKKFMKKLLFKNNNSMMQLNLYKVGDTWKFDDANNNIKAEPFVLGMSEIITYFSPNQETCTITFSNKEFPYSYILDLVNEENNGGWYNCSAIKGGKGWLCPVTKIYFNGMPKIIYFKIN